jgi:hypothetical protein
MLMYAASSVRQRPACFVGENFNDYRDEQRSSASIKGLILAAPLAPFCQIILFFNNSRI